MEQNLKQFLTIVLSPVGMGQEPEGWGGHHLVRVSSV